MLNEIRERVNECYSRLEALQDPTTFTFQPGAEEIWDEVNILRARCNHHFIDGICEYCDAEEEE